MLILKRLGQLEFLKIRCLLKNQYENSNLPLDHQLRTQRNTILSKILEKSSKMINSISLWHKILTRRDLKLKHEKKFLQFLYILKFQRQSFNLRLFLLNSVLWVAQHLLRNLIFQQNQSKACFKLTLKKNLMIKQTSLLMDSQFNTWSNEKISISLTLSISRELRMISLQSWERFLLIGWLRLWLNLHLNERLSIMLWTMLIDTCHSKRT